MKPDLNWSRAVAPIPSPFSNIEEYVNILCSLALDDSCHEEWQARCQLALNGEANARLRKEIPISVLRKFGVFFTSPKLANKLLDYSKTESLSTSYHDPACGMGDLLLAVARKLPIKKTLAGTLKAWGSRLSGTDLHVEFINAAKARLLILARLRHNGAKTKKLRINDYFPNIKVGDGTGSSDTPLVADCVVINPPFGAVKVPSSCTWASGKITQAAPFLIKVLEKIPAGTEVLAILPEVLRSGSFSHHWRAAVARLASVQIVKSHGIFDANTDIDVFILRLTKTSGKDTTKSVWPEIVDTHSAKVSDYFDVHIGRVVPHRDKKEGTLYPYIHARSVKPWTTMIEFGETLCHPAKGYNPPFVVVRRTSRPEQPHRAVATIVSGNVPVAVENHLIVCLPRDRSLAACETLMNQFEKDRTDEYLNERIRCRHLTVKAIREVPFDPNLP